MMHRKESSLVPTLGIALVMSMLNACGLIEPSAPDAEAGTTSHDASSSDGNDAALVHDAALPEPSDGSLVPVLDAEAIVDSAAQSDAAGQAAIDDASDAAPEDAGDGAPDAGQPVESDAGASCSSDADCAASSYCSPLSQRCKERCDAKNGCVGPSIAASNNRIATDGARICYADDGAATGEYVIRSWDGLAAQPITLGHGTDARVLLVADGYCYYSSPSLERAPLAGGPTQRVQTLESAPRRIWLTTDYVWWSAPHGELLDVYRVRRGTDQDAELVASVAATQLWEGGNSSYLFRRFKPTFASCALVMAPIDDLATETTIPMAFSKNCSGALWANEESVLFTQFEPVHYYPFRVDLSDTSVETTIRLHSQELLMYQVRRSFVYGQSVVDGASVVGVPNTVSYQRAGLNGSATERLFTPTPGTASYTVSPFELDDNVHRTFAVLDQRLVYQHLREFRLIVAPLLTDEADAGVPSD